MERKRTEKKKEKLMERKQTERAEENSKKGREQREIREWRGRKRTEKGRK